LTRLATSRHLSLVARDDDDKPAKKKASTKTSAKRTAKLPGAAQIRAAAIVMGGLVSFIGLMSIVGVVTSNLAGRFIGALVLAVVLPAIATERVLKRMEGKGSLALIGDVFAVVLMVLALFFVGAEAITRPLFTHEGDRYAKDGSRFMARTLYFLGGVTPTFPPDRPQATPASSASASAGGH
jgi:uncharacterized protein YqhQ